jgi:hypothetical protein
MCCACSAGGATLLAPGFSLAAKAADDARVTGLSVGAFAA